MGYSTLGESVRNVHALACRVTFHHLLSPELEYNLPSPGICDQSRSLVSVQELNPLAASVALEDGMP